MKSFSPLQAIILVKFWKKNVFQGKYLIVAGLGYTNVNTFSVLYQLNIFELNLNYSPKELTSHNL